MGTIDQRLHVLERELSRSRRINHALLIAVVAFLCIAGAQSDSGDESKPPQQSSTSDARSSKAGRPGADHPRTVEADQFILLDRLGRSRVRMEVTDDGPAIAMFDEEGQKRLELSQTNTASGLRLFDSGDAFVSLQLFRNGDPARLELRSKEGSSVMESQGLSVRDASEQGRLQLALVNGNYPTLGISHSSQSGPSSIELTASEGARSFKMHDRHGHSLFSVIASDDGETFLNMQHPDHERSLQISSGAENQDGPVMAFFAPAKRDGSGGLLPRMQFGLDGDSEPHVRVVDDRGQVVYAVPTR